MKLFKKLKNQYLVVKALRYLYKAFKAGVPVQELIDELRLNDEEAEAVRHFYTHLVNEKLI